MEYLVIFIIAFLMTFPLIIIFITQTSNIQADITNAEIQRAASKISDYAEAVYYMGPPAQKTLQVEFPQGISSVDVNESTITFNVTTTDMNYLVVEETVANLSGYIGNYAGPHILIFKAENNTVTITEK